MDFTLSPAIQELKQTTRRFVDEECIPLEKELEPDWIELPPELHQRLVEKIKALGLWAVGVPPEFGGAGLGAVGHTAIREEQCRSVIGTSHYTPFGGEIPPPLYFATDKQKERYLLPVLRGGKEGCFCANRARCRLRCRCHPDPGIAGGRRLADQRGETLCHLGRQGRFSFGGGGD